MIKSLGAVPTAKRLVLSGDIQSGRRRLRGLNSLHLSIESIMLEAEFAELFTGNEIAAARWRLDRAERV